MLYSHSYLAKAGIQCELLSFPARKGVKWWSQESFQEWKANAAELTPPVSSMRRWCIRLTWSRRDVSLGKFFKGSSVLGQDPLADALYGIISRDCVCVSKYVEKNVRERRSYLA